MWGCIGIWKISSKNVYECAQEIVSRNQSPVGRVSLLLFCAIHRYVPLCDKNCHHLGQLLSYLSKGNTSLNTYFIPKWTLTSVVTTWKRGLGRDKVALHLAMAQERLPLIRWHVVLISLRYRGKWGVKEIPKHIKGGHTNRYLTLVEHKT